MQGSHATRYTSDPLRSYSMRNAIWDMGFLVAFCSICSSGMQPQRPNGSLFRHRDATRRLQLSHSHLDCAIMITRHCASIIHLFVVASTLVVVTLCINSVLHACSICIHGGGSIATCCMQATFVARGSFGVARGSFGVVRGAYGVAVPPYPGAGHHPCRLATTALCAVFDAFRSS